MGGEASNEAEKLLRDNGRFSHNVIGPNVSGVPLKRVVLSPMHIEIGKVGDDIKHMGEELKQEFGADAEAHFFKMIGTSKEMGGLGCRRQEYHGGSYTGGHCAILLSGYETLLSERFVPPSWSRLNAWKRNLSVTNKIFCSLNKQEFLCEEEIEDTGVSIIELSDIICADFSRYSITPKLHILLCHSLSFLQEWKTMGLLNEQGLENLHSCLKKDSVMFRYLETQEVKHGIATCRHQNVRSLLT